MPNQIVPVTGLDQAGVIKDTPPTSIPQQAFSDVKNVRFRDGAVQKMEGEVNVFGHITKWMGAGDSDQPFDTDSIYKYVAWWPNPNLVAEYSGYYLIIAQQLDTETNRQRDYAYIVEPDGVPRNVSPEGGFEPDDQGNWQHTFFQGGFCLIINNGEDVPHYILDKEGNTDINEIEPFAQLPGWDSYNVQEVLLNDTFDDERHSRVFDMGQLVDYDQYVVAITIGTGDEFTIDSDKTVNNVTTSKDTETNTTIVTFADSIALDDSEVHITLRSNDPVSVRCGVIRSFGDFLVAANLSERNDTDLQVIVRNLPGVVRTSDVAIPGAIPNNWNPFAAGTNTADEYVVTQEGIVQDMVELQGSMYIYSNSSISILRQTGNPAVPISVTSVTDSYGVQTTNGVIQFDGQHFVVGSQDIYIFGGHPGNIQSVADGRVRDYFFSRLNPLHEQRMFLLRHRQKDEIWICYPTTESITGECDEALIWNYRKNNWTIRDLYNVVAGDVGPVPGGGVPSQLVHMEGVSGDNGVTNIGANEVQTLSIASSTTLPGDTDGHSSVWTITVDTDITPYSTAGGTPIHDIILGTDFNTGVGNDIKFFARGLDTDNHFTFNFEIDLPDNTVNKNQIRAALEADSDFNANLNYIDLADSEQEFVIEVTNQDTVTSTISFGVQQLFTQDELVRDSDRDIAQRNHVNDDTSEYERVVTSIYIDPTMVGKRYYLNYPGDGDFPDGTIIEQIPDLGLNQVMYDDTVQTPSPATNLMYKAGRGGLTARPVRNNNDTDTEQVMYRDRANDANDFQVNEPWIPLQTGYYDLAILVPKSATDFNWDSERMWEFQAYNDPNTSIGSAILNYDADEDLTRKAFPDSLNVTDAYPILHVRMIKQKYNALLEGMNDPWDTDEAVSLHISLGGTWTDSATMADDLSDHISESIHDAVESYFDSVNSGHVSTLTSREVGRWTVEIDGIGGNPHGLVVDNFKPARVKAGQYVLRTFDPDMDYADSVLEAIYPTVEHRITEINNLNNVMLTKTYRVTDDAYVKGIQNSTADLDAAHIMEGILEDPFYNDSQDGWSSSDLPSGYNQLTNHARMIGAYDRSDGVYRQRPVRASWETKVIRTGNTLTEFKTAEELTTDWNFEWSYGNTTINGITVSSSNDYRGAYPQYATPTYMGVLIYNTEAENDLEAYITVAGSRGDYDIEDQTGTNGETLTNEEAAEKWIQDLRLANRRLNVLDRGTDGQFLIQPANYDETANFILQIAFNTTDEGRQTLTDWSKGISDYRQPGVTFENITLNARSDQLFYNRYGDSEHQFDSEGGVAIASNSPTAVVQSGWTQITATPATDTRRPDTMIRETTATLDNTETYDERDGIFDVDRPWPRGEVNFNKYFPIFAQNTILGETANSNKITGADIGWSRPAFADSERVENINRTDLTLTGNDAPISYRSYIQRDFLPLSPEFEVESIGGIALWADGNYIPGFFDAERYPRLVVDSWGLNAPGDSFNASRDRFFQNQFFVSEDYKTDHRTNGRFLNIHIADDYVSVPLGDNEIIKNDKAFAKQTPWRINGVQLEIMKGGQR